MVALNDVPDAVLDTLFDARFTDDALGDILPQQPHILLVLLVLLRTFLVRKTPLQGFPLQRRKRPRRGQRHLECHIGTACLCVRSTQLQGRCTAKYISRPLKDSFLWVLVGSRGSKQSVVADDGNEFGCHG